MGEEVIYTADDEDLTAEDVTTSMPMMSFVPSGAARIIVGMSTEERFVNRWKENDGKAY